MCNINEVVYNYLNQTLVIKVNNEMFNYSIKHVTITIFAVVINILDF